MLHTARNCMKTSLEMKW